MYRSKLRWTTLLAAGIAAGIAPGIAGCDAGEPPLVDERPPDFSATIDVGAVIRQVHHAYREEDGAFVSADPTYAVRVDEARRVTIRARDGTSDTEAELQLETVSIERDSGGALLENARARVLQDGRLEIARGVADEHLVNGENGVEQSWLFREAPSGTGELVVRVRARGIEHSGETESGHHFFDHLTGLGLRYGHATFIDFRGARTPVRVSREGDELVMRVPAQAIDEATYPAVLDPVISPELGSDRPVRGGSSTLSSFQHTLACERELCLVAWADRRANLTPDIYAARINAAGQVLDPAGIRVSRTPQILDSWPSAIWAGDRFIVAWLHDQSGARHWRNTSIGRDGSVGSESPMADSGIISQPARFAFDGKRLVFVFADNNGAYFLRLHANGSTETPRTLLGFGGTISGVDVDWDGSSFVAAFSYSVGPNFVDAALIPSDPSEGDAALVGVWNTSTLVPLGGIACGSGECLMTFRDEAGALQGIILSGTRVGWPFQVVPAYGVQPGPVAFDGTRYLVSWTLDSFGSVDVYCTRVDRGGTIQTDIPIGDSTDVERAPQLARAGDAIVVSWGRGTASSASRVLARRVSLSGADYYGDITDVTSRVSNDQRAPSAAFDGTNYLLVWDDDRGAASRAIMGARISQNGQLLDPIGIEIAGGPSDRRKPSVAFGGGVYLVAWEGEVTNRVGIFAKRVSSAGFVTSAPAIELSNSSSRHSLDPQVAASGSGFFVIWEEMRSLETDIAGRAVNFDGTLPSMSPMYITALAAEENDPTIAYNASSNNYVVAWTDWSAGAESSPDLIGGVFSATSPSTPVPFVIAAGPVSQSHAAAAYDETANVVVAWEEPNPMTGVDIRAARISGTGVVIDSTGVSIAAGAGDQTEIALAHSGSRMMIVWKDTASSAAGDIRAIKVRDVNLLPSTGEEIISAGADPERSPAVAAASGGRYLIGYESDVSAWSKTRVRARLYAP